MTARRGHRPRRRHAGRQRRRVAPGSRCVAGRSGVGPITDVRRRDLPGADRGHGQGLRRARSLPDRAIARHLSRAARLRRRGGAGGARGRRRRRRAPTSPYERGVAMGGTSAARTCRSWSTCRTTIQRVRRRAVPPGAASDVLERDQNVAAATIGHARRAARGRCSASAPPARPPRHASARRSGASRRATRKLMIAGGYDALTTWLDVLGFGAARRADHASYNDEPEQASRPFDERALRLRARRGRGGRGPRGLESARGARRADPRASRRLRLEHERLPDDRRRRPTAAARSLAMANALKESGLAPDEIDYVVGPRHQHAGQRHVARRWRSSGCSATTPTSWRSARAKSMTGHLTCGGGRR